MPIAERSEAWVTERISCPSMVIRPDDGDRVARRRLERYSPEDRPVRVVMERNVLETDRAPGNFEIARARRVANFRMLVEDVEHRPDVEDRLLDLAIHHAHEIERLIELQHHYVQESEIARCIASHANIEDAHHEQADPAEG